MSLQLALPPVEEELSEIEPALFLGMENEPLLLEDVSTQAIEIPVVRPRNPRGYRTRVRAAAHISNQTEWLHAKDVSMRAAGVPPLSRSFDRLARWAMPLAVGAALAAGSALLVAWMAFS